MKKREERRPSVEGQAWNRPVPSRTFRGCRRRGDDSSQEEEIERKPWKGKREGTEKPNPPGSVRI